MFWARTWRRMTSSLLCAWMYEYFIVSGTRRFLQSLVNRPHIQTHTHTHTHTLANPSAVRALRDLQASVLSQAPTATSYLSLIFFSSFFLPLFSRHSLSDHDFLSYSLSYSLSLPLCPSLSI